jgi:hypothetical protein
MLAKMPQQNLKTAKSGVNYKLALLIILIVGLGLGAVYTMIPLLQTTEPVYLTANLTNNTTTHAPNAVHIKKTNNNPTNSTKIQTTTLKNSTQNVPKAVSTSQKVTKTN